jgi:hypothetical protein
MSTSTEDRLTRALHELADVPGPPSMAGAALAGARRDRRRRAVVGTAAGLAAVAAIAAPLALRPGSEPAPFEVAGPGPATQVADDCVGLPVDVSAGKEVPAADWPRFVRTAVDALPARADYVMQSGYDFCHPSGAAVSDAYAVINLGHRREQGHLTLNLSRAVPSAQALPSTCAQAPAELATTRPPTPDTAAGEVLFCADATAAEPFVLGFAYYGQITVAAIWPDGRTIWIESIPEGGRPPAVDGAQLRSVVTDGDLVGLIPNG